MALVKITWNGDAILDAVKAGIEAAVTREVEAVAAEARRLCPVGGEAKAQPATLLVKSRRKADKGTRHRGQNSGSDAWRERNPGTLRDSIFARVRWKDGVCLGWVKAGADGSGGRAFYAPFVELGTRKMQAHPFLRPAMAKIDLDRIAQEIMSLAASKVR